MNRHHLIELQPEDVFSFLDSSLDASVQQKIQQMIQQHMPFTVCRQDTDAYFKVAANCFVHGQKYRVALGLASAPVLSRSPLQLCEILDDFDPPAQRLMQQFILRMQQLGCTVHVYGSYACQHLYQENFVHAQSDLDLLIEASSAADLSAILSAIVQLKSQLAVPLDGEIALTHGRNISFNELIFALTHQQDSIIVKELRAISLKKSAEIFGGNLHALHHSCVCPA